MTTMDSVSDSTWSEESEQENQLLLHDIEIYARDVELEFFIFSHHFRNP